jgi:hypothetical protein
MKKFCTLLALAPVCVAAVNAQTISDNFNDNSRDPALWGAPYILEGNGQLLEQNGRTEFTTAGGGSNNEVGQTFLQRPTYDQAWQVQMVASMSTANFSVAGDVGTVRIGIGSGDHWLELGYGAGILAQGAPLGTALVTEWSTGDNITVTPLPSAVGFRFTYDPQLHLVQAHYNLDAGLAEVGWVLYQTFTIDGSTVAGAETLNWNMTTGDGFYLMILGWSSGPAIAAGSAWADDFTYQLGSGLTGYDLWASAISDEGMRGTTSDASGNGIANLLQYMYGLDPLATDTDVKLKIQLNAGIPELIHGFNSTATDYTIDYQEKPALTDAWSGGFVPTLIETFDASGKTFRRVTLPAAVGDEFLQLEIVPQL